MRLKASILSDVSPANKVTSNNNVNKKTMKGCNLMNLL